MRVGSKPLGGLKNEAAPREAYPLGKQPGTPRNRTGEIWLQLVRGGSISESQTPPVRKHGIAETHGQLATIEKNSLQPALNTKLNRKFWWPT